ncbi:MAG: class I adenylate-forming enzyme family protein [Bacteroidota bacterium]
MHSFDPLKVGVLEEEALFPKKTIEYLRNADYSMVAPIYDGLVFFNESDFFAESLLQKKIAKIQAETEGQRIAYEQFIRQKGRRPNYDIYACFQSFNEAFKAFFPLIKIVQKKLQPGDVILNLWDRTGWLGAFLQGLFPAQRVVTLWEGNKDVLGYKGFHFWYTNQAEASNMQLAFADLNKPLPFADNSVGMVFGLDTFHRFDQSLLLRELLRITPEEAPILFPHVHLTNNEPDPFFERGCRQLHGRDYDAFFQQLLKRTSRAGFVFPEPEMFTINELSGGKPFPIKSQPSTDHYNAMLAILPQKWAEEEQMEAFHMEDLPDFTQAHILVNPLLRIDFARQQVHVDRGRYSDRVGYLLDRHPIYMEKLKKADGHLLSELQVKVLYLASRLHSVSEIGAALQVEPQNLFAPLKDLEERDIIQLAPVGKQHLRLQQYVSTQEYVVPASEQTLQALWQRAVEAYPEAIFLVSELDESEFTYEECQEIIEQIQLKLIEEGLQTGDRIALLTANHFEAVLTILATVNNGMVAVPIEYRLGIPQVQHILDEVNPSIIFIDQHTQGNYAELLTNYQLVQFDDLEEEGTGHTYFSDWVESVELEILPDYRPDTQDLATILYTSGSTGMPKGVMHTHGHLFRSSRLITETFQWDTVDRLMALGELDSMSGLRNTCFAPLEVGASVVIPTVESKDNLFSIAESISLNEATLMGTTPALLAQLLRFESRVRIDLRNVRQIICTGSYLSPELKTGIYEKFNIPVLNYYGLTETTGICIAEEPDTFNAKASHLGMARGCLLQVVDSAGKVLPADEQGELRIYGENVMPGYYKKDTKSAAVLRNGWFYTEDLAMINARGEVSLLGRKREIIKTADGLLIYPSQVVDTLQQHPKVADVAVIPVQRNEVEGLKIFLVTPGIQAKSPTWFQPFKDFLLAQIGDRKIALDWELLPAIPRNVNGKVQTSALNA